MATPSIDRGGGEGDGYLEGTYCYVCRECRGLGLVEEHGKVEDCPICAIARENGAAFDVVRRDVTPTFVGRTASPAVASRQYAYEVYRFVPAPAFPRARAKKVGTLDSEGAALILRDLFEMGAC
jgi:hypothetical protein